MLSNSLISVSLAFEDRTVGSPWSVEARWENIGDLVTASILYTSLAVER